MLTHKWIWSRIPISPPRVDSSKGPNRLLNRAHWPTKENMCLFAFFSVYGKNGLGWPQMGPGDLFPTNLDLADILGRMDLNFEFLFFIFRTPHFWNARSPDLQASGFPGPQISKFPDLQIPRSSGSQISRRRRTNSQIPT